MEPRAAAILKVTSVVETMRWYQTVGFEVNGEEPDEGDSWLEMRHGALVLQFLSGETPWPAPPTFTGCFYVHTTNVEDVLERVRETARPEWGLEHRPWGSLELTLQDPDGYYVTFTQESGTQESGTPEPAT